MDFNPDNLSDEELVAHSLINPDFFGFIIDRYEVKLDRYIRRISALSNEDRKDILQDIFIAVYQNLNAYKSSMKFSSWLYRIAHNRTISWWRRHKNTTRDVSIDEHQEFIETFFNENNIERDSDGLHVKNGIQYAFGKIKQEYKDLLILKFNEDMSYEDLADMFTCTTGTIGTRIARAKKQFIKYYNEYEGKH